MKFIRLTSIAGALFLLSLTTPPGAMAQTEPYSSGLYRFLLEDDQVKSLEFEASTVRGITTGFMTFVDDARIPDTDDGDVPGDGMPFYIKADLNSMTVEKNRAVMGGIVRDTSHKTYLGKFVQLVVEDNGQELRIPDRLTWTFCSSRGSGWVPSDAERKDDDGAYLSWWATDAERRDDVGIPSPNLLPYEPKSCPAYPLGLYDFANVTKWDGDIVVRP
jgi:hypothetical protein